MNTLARLSQVALAGFVATQFTSELVNSQSPDGLDPVLRFVMALSWAWLASAVCLFSRRALAWRLCLVFSTLGAFVALYITFMNITGKFIEPSGRLWSTTEIVGPFVTLFVFVLHLHTGARYRLPEEENAS